MDAGFLVIGLALFTLLVFVAFAMKSRADVKKRMQDDDAPKSTLAADADSHGKPADV